MKTVGPGSAPSGAATTIHRSDRGQGRIEVGVQVRAVDDRWVQGDARVDGGDQLDQALVRQPGDPGGVDLAEPAYADQDQAGGRGNRTCGCRKSRLILARTGETDAIRTTGLENAFTKVHHRATR